LAQPAAGFLYAVCLLADSSPKTTLAWYIIHVFVEHGIQLLLAIMCVFYLNMQLFRKEKVISKNSVFIDFTRN